MPNQKDIFRKASLDRLSSPEKLNDYIRVSRPGVWIVFAAVIIITAAALFWACTAVITSDGLRPVDFFLR